MPRDPSISIYLSNMTVIQQQAQCQLTSTSTSTNSLKNGVWSSALIADTISTEDQWYCQRTHRACSNSWRETRQRIPSSGWHFPLSSSTYFHGNILCSLGIKQIYDLARPNSSKIAKKLLRRKNVTLRRCAQEWPAHTCQARSLPTLPLLTQSHIDIPQ